MAIVSISKTAIDNAMGVTIVAPVAAAAAVTPAAATATPAAATATKPKTEHAREIRLLTLFLQGKGDTIKQGNLSETCSMRL